MSKRLFCLLASLCLCGCAEIVLLATSASTPGPAQLPAAGGPEQPPQGEGVSVRVLLRDPKGNPASGATILAYPDGQERTAKELAPGEYQFDSLPAGNGINFEAYKDGQVTGGHFAPLRDKPNVFEMQFK